MKTVKKIFLGIAAVLAVLLVYVFASKAITDRKMERETAMPQGGISSLESVTIGGISQWILIRGEKKDNPILLYIHGGPGSTEMFMSRKMDTEIVKDFVVVHWDQRGAGKSYSPFIPSASYNREQYLSDTYELVSLLKKRFSRNKIYIMGHSWGSYLAAVTAHRHPDDFCAFVGIGQMVNAVENESVSYDFALKRALIEENKEAFNDLLEIGKPPYKTLGQMMTQRKWLTHFGGGMFHGEHSKDGFAYMGSFMSESPDYSILDSVRFFLGMITTLRNVWGEFFTLDLYTQAPSFKVPVYFMTGRHDYNTPFEILVRFEKDLQAPKKKIYWFEQSAHSPNFEEPAAFAQALREIKSDGCKQ